METVTMEAISIEANTMEATLMKAGTMNMAADGATNPVRIGELELKFHCDETQGAGDLVVFDFLIPANARVPAAHYHQRVDELICGLEGTITTTIDGERHALNPGDALFIRRGRVHQHENLAPAAARALVVLHDGSIGRRYFEELAAAVNIPGKPDPAKIKDIMQRHGLMSA